MQGRWVQQILVVSHYRKQQQEKTNLHCNIQGLRHHHGTGEDTSPSEVHWEGENKFWDHGLSRPLNLKTLRLPKNTGSASLKTKFCFSNPADVAGEGSFSFPQFLFYGLRDWEKLQKLKCSILYIIYIIYYILYISFIFKSLGTNWRRVLL